MSNDRWTRPSPRWFPGNLFRPCRVQHSLDYVTFHRGATLIMSRLALTPAIPAARSMIRALSAAVVLSIVAARAGNAQATASAAKVRKPAVCAAGVRMYTDKSQVPIPHDTLTLPPTDGPIRVTN